ncbi:MAG: hypothetical protein LBB42_00785 [Coriobacteriales bacterium]|jgi:hypothetical protein|nr:hypothetical protein [Coriobacteriales bacterium]
MNKFKVFISLFIVSLFLSTVFSVNAFASASNPAKGDMQCVLLCDKVTNGRSVMATTYVSGYTPTKLSVKVSAVKYPGGASFISAGSASTVASKTCTMSKKATGYTGKITGFSTHDLWSGGKTVYQTCSAAGC